MAEKIKEAEVHTTLDRLVNAGLSSEYIRQCHEWWYLKARLFPEVYEEKAMSYNKGDRRLAEAFKKSKSGTPVGEYQCDMRSLEEGLYSKPFQSNETANRVLTPELTTEGDWDKYTVIDPHSGREVEDHFFYDGLFQPDIFLFPDFVEWYRHFFLKQIKEVKLPEPAVHAMKQLEYTLREVAPQDPTIYPLVEKPLGVACRTTRSDGGRLLLIEALLPKAPSIKVVVKKVPPVWEELFEQELKTHKTLLALGYEREVTAPIAHQEKGRIITYGYLAGDLSALCTQPEEVKQRELWKAVELLLPMSLDLTSYFGRERVGFFDRSPRKPPLLNHVAEVETVWELVKDKIQLESYLTQSFLKNLIFRTTLAKDGYHLREVDTRILKISQQILSEEAEVVTEEEWFRRTTPDFNFTKPYHSENEFRDYLSLLKAATSAKARALFQHYQQTIAPALAALPLYVGHDDFTIKNILATDIGTDSKGHLLYSGLKMHDVGLVMAPFQSYLYDLLVSAHASPETSEELLQRTYRALLRGCEQRGRAVPVQNTYSEFREGYHLVAVDKHLRQASIKFMIQSLEEKAAERETKIYSPLKPEQVSPEEI